MALTYDFDMVPVTPNGLPDQFGDLAASGLAAQKVAMFRNPQTVAALGQADAAVRTFFVESGFALQSYDSGAPIGRYPMRDEDARVDVIEKLSANLGTHDLTGADWGGFDFQAFMRALSVAEPVADTLLAPPPRSRTADPDLIAARIASRQRQGRRKMALGGLLLGVILLFYVASKMLV